MYWGCSSEIEADGGIETILWENTVVLLTDVLLPLTFMPLASLPADPDTPSAPATAPAFILPPVVLPSPVDIAVGI